MIAEVRKLRLEPKLEGMELVVRLPDATRVAIQKILGDAKTSEPERSKVYDWWLANFDRGELHHVWPKWLLGDEGQVCLRLPRCIHNMTGVGLDDGGFHQRLNALFAASDRFQGIRAEDKEAFGEALAAATQEGTRARFLAEVQQLLLETYSTTMMDPGVLGPLRTMLEIELKRLTEKT